MMGPMVPLVACCAQRVSPQRTLDQGTMDRVRALGQEANAKAKQRAAVLLDGHKAQPQV